MIVSLGFKLTGKRELAKVTLSNNAVLVTAARLRICISRAVSVGRRPETAGVRPAWP